MKFNRIIPPVACDSPDSNLIIKGTYFLRNSYGMIRMFSVTVEGHRGRTVHVQRSFSTRAELESFLSKSAKDRDNDMEEYYRDVKACFESMGEKMICFKPAHHRAQESATTWNMVETQRLKRGQCSSSVAIMNQ